MARRDASSIASAILGPAKEAEPETGAAADGGDEDTESAALGAVADQMLAAFKTGDREGLVDALRSIVMLR